MDRKRNWLNANESGGYGYAKINKFPKEDNDDVYLKLDEKRKISHDFDENNRIKCKKSKC